MGSSTVRCVCRRSRACGDACRCRGGDVALSPSVSRILDALRRGRGPTPPSSGGRPDHADAVLAALGYKSDRPRRSNSAVVLVLIVLSAVGISVWYMRTATLASKAPAPAALKTQTHAEARQSPEPSRRGVTQAALVPARMEPR